MQIEQEETGTLTAVLKVKLAPEDYSVGVEKALKEQRRTAVLPGFRPGQVPMTIIKKKVGKAVLVNEVERLISKGISDHIRNNAVKVLGQPLPKNDSLEANDWDSPGEFLFQYEMGLAPEVDVTLGKDLKVERFLVDVNDELVQREIDDMQRRFGKMADAERSEENDMLLGDMIQLDAKGGIKEGGIMNRATISLQFLKDDATRQSLVGKVKGDEVVVDPHKVSSDHDDLARMLGVEHDAVHDLQGDLLFRIAEVKRIAPIPVDQELFDRVYGQGAVADEADFRAKVKSGMEAMFNRDTDRLFMQSVLKVLEGRMDVQLPDSFLKRWILETSKDPVTPEEVEAGYADYARNLKKQLLQDTIISKYGLEAKGEELDAFAKRYVADQFAQYGMPEPDPGTVQQAAARILGDREQLDRMRNSIVEQKMLAHFKAMLEPVDKMVGYDAFVELARTF